MKPVAEWTEEDVLSLPYGEFDWLEAKGRRAIDLTLPNVREADILPFRGDGRGVTLSA